MRRSALIAMVVAVLHVVGCGTGVVSQFPDRLIGADGQLIVLEAVEAITSDPDLSEDEKREELRELGLEDEKLIDALLAR